MLTLFLHSKQFQADRTSRDQELAAYKNQYEQLRVDHKQRVEQLLNSLREAEENHGNSAISTTLNSFSNLKTRTKRNRDIFFFY